MVENLLQTGTPFDYGHDDVWEKDEANITLNTPPIMVGERNNPTKNQIYIDKDWEDE